MMRQSGNNASSCEAEATPTAQLFAVLLHRTWRAARRQGLQTARQRPISVCIALGGWIALVALSAVPDSVCVTTSSTNGTAGGRRVCLQGEAYWTLALLLGALLLMANEASPDLVMLAFTVVLSLSEIISNAEAFAGFGSTSVLAIGALFVVARALEETRAVERLLLPVLGRPSGHVSALLRLSAPVALFSAFLNNTPIVAMLLGICEQWAARSNLSIKVLLMPLSFASSTRARLEPRTPNPNPNPNPNRGPLTKCKCACCRWPTARLVQPSAAVLRARHRAALDDACWQCSVACAP
jgi:hypothetical protein